jgi:hypothetical protein
MLFGAAHLPNAGIFLAPVRADGVNAVGDRAPSLVANCSAIFICEVNAVHQLPVGHRQVWTTPADQGLIFGSVRVLGAVMSSAFCAEDEFRWP